MDNEISGIYSLDGVCVITQDADEDIILPDDCKHIIFCDKLYSITSLVINECAYTVDFFCKKESHRDTTLFLLSLYISKNIKKSVLVPILHLYFTSLCFKGHLIARNKLAEFILRQDYDAYWEELNSDDMLGVTKDLLSDLRITVY